MFHHKTGKKMTATTAAATHGPGVASQRLTAGVVSRNSKTPANRKTAVYLESRANPPSAPAASHCSKARSRAGGFRTIDASTQAAANRKNTRGPSGRIQL